MNKRQAKKKLKKFHSSERYIFEMLLKVFYPDITKDGKKVVVFGSPDGFKAVGIKQKFQDLSCDIDYKFLEYKMSDGNVIYLYSSEKITGFRVCSHDEHYDYTPFIKITEATSDEQKTGKEKEKEIGGVCNTGESRS